jgi:hypothetical protein
MNGLVNTINTRNKWIGKYDNAVVNIDKNIHAECVGKCDSKGSSSSLLNSQTKFNTRAETD